MLSFGKTYRLVYVQIDPPFIWLDSPFKSAQSMAKCFLQRVSQCYGAGALNSDADPSFQFGMDPNPNANFRTTNNCEYGLEK